jgi:hypothetical protein
LILELIWKEDWLQALLVAASLVRVDELMKRRGYEEGGIYRGGAGEWVGLGLGSPK